MRRITLTIAFFLIITSVSARQNDPGLPGEDPDVPIDGGIGLLLAAGVVYGIKKIRASNNDNAG